MSASSPTVTRPGRKTILSTLWVFLSVNYIYCDVLSHMDPVTLRELNSGTVGSIPVTQGFLLSAALMMQIPFLMIVLSRVLPYRVNRWANIIAGAIMVVIQLGTMGMGTPPTLHYWFYSAVEVIANLIVVWYAWKWTALEG